MNINRNWIIVKKIVFQENIFEYVVNFPLLVEKLSQFRLQWVKHCDPNAVVTKVAWLITNSDSCSHQVANYCRYPYLL